MKFGTCLWLILEDEKFSPRANPSRLFLSRYKEMSEMVGERFRQVTAAVLGV